MNSACKVVLTLLSSVWLSDDQWVRCDNIWIRPTDGKQFLETLDLLVDAFAPLSMVFKLAIGIEGE